MSRVYLDYNATAPLREEARAAMIAAMDVVGNPSSVHAEGRAAKGLVERARAQVAALVGCKTSQVIFTGSATEAAALAVAQKDQHGGVFAALQTEHDCFWDWRDDDIVPLASSGGQKGQVKLLGYDHFARWVGNAARTRYQGVERDLARSGARFALLAISMANSETGIMLPNGKVKADEKDVSFEEGSFPYSVVCDITQVAGKALIVHEGDKRPSYMILSAHKLGGPKGVGALINFTADDPKSILRGGGQEMGRRSGTENVIGIAGFGAAAQAAQRDLASGVWARVEKLRNILEKTIADGANKTIFVGKSDARLPNTSCILTPGWKGETQVMQMDLAGFAISAGSACSSGKMRPSRVLQAMGFSEAEAACAIRVSLGPETTDDEIRRFAQAWLAAHDKYRARAA